MNTKTLKRFLKESYSFTFKLNINNSIGIRAARSPHELSYFRSSDDRTNKEGAHSTLERGIKTLERKKDRSSDGRAKIRWLERRSSRSSPNTSYDHCGLSSASSSWWKAFTKSIILIDHTKSSIDLPGHFVRLNNWLVETSRVAGKTDVD